MIDKLPQSESESRVLFFVTPQTIQSMEFSRPGHHPNPGIKPRFPALRVDSLSAEPQGKPKSPQKNEWKNHALSPGETINNQNHGQIRVCIQGWLEEKEERGFQAEEKLRPFLWDSGPERALLSCRKENIHRGPWISVCVFMQNFISFWKVFSPLYF